MPLALFLAATGCTEQGRFDPTPVALAADRATTGASLVVDPTHQAQTITGFGASSAWSSGISASAAELLFSPENGIGLSLLRMHIAPDGTTSETSIAKLAVARGVKVWASPWSPPGEWKSTGTDTNGGSLLPENYQAWADRLTSFVLAQKAAGVPLVALSSQNEPNWTATWESCVYTADQLTTFVRDYLGPTMARDCPDVKLLTPETIDWNTLAGFADTLLADPGAQAAVGIVAVHDYGGVPYAYAAPAANGKEFWETEVSYDDQTGILAALETARNVHLHLTTGGVNAFHYWWLLADQNGKGGLLANDALLPQAYGLGHFSKFVRPGYVRLDVASAPATGLSTSAFTDPNSGRIVIVAVNENESASDLSLSFVGALPVALDPWLTTADVSLAEQAPVTVTNPLDYSLPPQSITTLVTLDVLPPPQQGDGGEGGETNGSAGASGTSGASGEAGAATSNDGSASSPGSGGTGGTHSGGGTKTPRGGSQSIGGSSEAGAPQDLDAGVTDDAGTPRHVPGKYYACLCRVPEGDRGHGAGALPIVALVAVLAGRRRSRAGRVSGRGA